MDNEKITVFLGFKVYFSYFKQYPLNFTLTFELFIQVSFRERL